MGRILELDALRGITAVIIMAAHIGLMSDSAWVFSSVDLFFVLSGYFITTNIMKNARKPGFLWVFFSRRALRIWPAYFVGLATCLALHPFLKWDKPPDALLYYLTFTQNIPDYFGQVAPQFSGMFLHTWTLAIEEQFYILWPVLLFRAGRRTSGLIMLGFVALPAVLRSAGLSPFLLLTRCDGLAMGSVLALVLSDKERLARNLRRYRLGFAALGLAALLLPMAIASEWKATGVDAFFTSRASLTYFGLAGFVLCAQGHPALAILRDARLCHLGRISYGLYLYHPLVFATLPRLYTRYVTRKLGIESTLLMSLVMLGVCVVVAELSRRWLEDPIVALKERLTYKEGPTAYRGPHAAAVSSAVRAE